MFTLRPFTLKWPWRTSWRASFRVSAKPSCRVVDLSFIRRVCPLSAGSSKLDVFWKLVQEAQVDPGRTFTENIQTPFRDLVDSTAGVSQQARHFQMGLGPCNPIPEDLLNTAWQQCLSFLFGQFELIGKSIHGLANRMFLTVLAVQHQRQHDGLEIGYRHSLYLLKSPCWAPSPHVFLMYQFISS